MDQLVHTWDLATAIGVDHHLDDELVDAVCAMFLPQMPEIGRSSSLTEGLVPGSDSDPCARRARAWKDATHE